MATNFTVNDKAASTDAPPTTPLLWVIREGLKLTGPSSAAAPACAAPARCTSTASARLVPDQVSDVAGKSVTTIEGLRRPAIRCRGPGSRRTFRSAATASPGKS